MEKKTSRLGGGLGLMPVGIITTLLLTILKLTDVINWSWLWILSPIWIVVGLEFIAFIIALVVALKVSKKKPSVEEWEEHFNDGR